MEWLGMDEIKLLLLLIAEYKIKTNFFFRKNFSDKLHTNIQRTKYWFYNDKEGQMLPIKATS